MPTITTIDAAWTSGITMDEGELRRAETTSFLGDGSNNGVRGGIVRHGDNSLAVAVNGSDQITVQSGAFVIPGATGLGVYRGSLPATTSAVGIAARNATNPRIDLVVIQIVSGQAQVRTVDGTASSSPSAPALPANAIEIARLNVPRVANGAVVVDTSWRTYATGLGGTLYAESSARLPGSGNQKGQKAVALDTGIEHYWDGTGWWAGEAEVGATSISAGASISIGTNSTLWRRGRMGVATLNLTATAARVSGDNLILAPVGFRPRGLIYTQLYAANGTDGQVYRVHLDTDGTLRTQVAIGNGIILRGTITYPIT